MHAGLGKGQGDAERETRAEAVAPRSGELPALATGKDGDSSPPLQELLGGAPDPARLARVIAAHPRERERLLAACHQHFGNAVVSAILGDPALAPPTVEADGAGGEAALRNLAADTTVNATPDAPAPAPKNPATDIARKLDWVPAGVRGPKGEAAWLAQAASIGFLTAGGGSDTQLAELKASAATVTSVERNRGKDKNGVPFRREIPGQVTPGPDTNPDEHKYGHYQVKVDSAPILHVLVALLKTRIKEWEAAGGGKVVSQLNIGMLVRGDPGFDQSPHRTAAAVDLHGKFKDDTDVIGLLEDLEPAEVGSVFPDNPNHLHIQMIGGKYHFGMPFGPSFFPPELGQDVAQRKAAAEKAAAPAADGDTLEVEQLVLYKAELFKHKGTYDEKKKRWVWTWSQEPGGARSKLQSGTLESALAQVNSKAVAAKAAKAAGKKPRPDAGGDGKQHER